MTMSLTSKIGEVFRQNRHVTRQASVLMACLCIGLVSAAGARAQRYSRHHKHHKVTINANTSVGHKKVIWFGGILAPTDLTADSINNVGKAFDGFVIQGVAGSQDNAKHNENLATYAFSKRTYTLDKSSGGDYIGDSLAALQALPSGPAPYRFLRINLFPADYRSLDWKDDAYWSNVVHNLTVASQFAHDANLRGIVFDTEIYHPAGAPHIFAHNDVRASSGYSGMSNEDLETLVEQRGKQVIQALNSHMPTLEIINTFSYSVFSPHVTHDNIAGADNGLLVPFLDGMLDNSTPTTTFADGFEQAYWHDDTTDYFSRWAKLLRDPGSKNRSFQKYPAKFGSQYQVGFGIFLDRSKDTTGNTDYGWCGDGKSRVFYSPERLAYTIQQAGRASDEYVWVYTQKPNPWIAAGSAPTALPTIYAEAIRDGIRHANDTSSSLPSNNDPVAESAVCK